MCLDFVCSRKPTESIQKSGVLKHIFRVRFFGVAMQMTPETLLAAIMTVLITAYLAVVLLCRWITRIHPKPDPWDTDMDVAVRQPDAVPICHKCMSPQSPTSWFCPECGTSVGPYNNCLPYIYIFSIGEVFTAGAWRNVPVNALTVIGFFLASVSEYMIFAPLYWIRLWRNLSRIRREAPNALVDQ